MSGSEDGELCFTYCVDCRCHSVGLLRGPDEAAVPWFCSSMSTELAEMGKFPVALRVPRLVRSAKRRLLKVSPSGMSQRTTAPSWSDSAQVFSFPLTLSNSFKFDGSLSLIWQAVKQMAKVLFSGTLWFSRSKEVCL